MSAAAAITSSTTSNQQHQQHSPTRMLTDFSIHSLIGEPAQVEEDEDIDVEVQVEDGAQVGVSKRRESAQAVAAQQRKYRPKNFRCPACKMAFSNNGQLKNHVRIHTGERPFRCAHRDCNKTFTRNEELTRHKLIHTGVRPHACTICGKRFGRKDHLKKHVRTHDRKRIRRKVFVQSGAPFHMKDEHMFAPAKLRAAAACQSLSPVCLVPPSANIPMATTTSAPVAKLVTSMPPPALPTVSAPLLAFSPAHPTTVTSTATVQAPSANTATTLQQLATDYWNKWYNLLGLYQHHQPQFYHPAHNQNVVRPNHLLKK